MKKKILIIRLGSLGDIILSSSTVINTKIKYPESSLIYLTKEKFRPVVEMIDGVDEIVTISDDISAFQYFKFLIELDKKDFDTVIDLHGNFRSLAARKLLTANNKVIYPKRRMERMLAVKNKIIPDTYPHTIDLYNQTILELNGKAFLNRPLLTPACSKDESVEKFIKENKPFVFFAPGAAHPTKAYDIDNFAETACALYESEQVGIIWAVTEDQKDIPEILSKIQSSSFMPLVNCEIKKLAYIISKASLTIANDSGIAHLSSGVNTPVISIFGPTHPVLGFAPRGLYDQVIQVEEECRPCSLHGKTECFREQRFCFDKIEPEQIVELAKHKLKNCITDNKAVFIDRDGTIIVEKHFLSDPDEIEFIEGSVDALKRLQRNGFKLIVVSNQSGVARGKFDIQTVETVNRKLVELLTTRDVYVDAVYYCPHHPNGTSEEYAVSCQCRKPAPLMVEEAIHQIQVDPRKSFVVGDKIDDINLGKVVGAKSVLVRTGYGKKYQHLIDSSHFYHDVKICDNLSVAEEYISGMISDD